MQSNPIVQNCFGKKEGMLLSGEKSFFRSRESYPRQTAYFSAHILAMNLFFDFSLYQAICTQWSSILFFRTGMGFVPVNPSREVKYGG